MLGDAARDRGRHSRSSAGSRLGDSAKELVAALLSLAPAVLSLREGALAAYHGAEHIAIGSYEHGEPRAREHERCGTHLVGPLLVTTAVGNVARLPRAAALPQRRAGSARPSAPSRPRPRSSAGCSATPRRSLARALAKPGHEFQHRIATAEPTPDQLAVAEAALARASTWSSRRRSEHRSVTFDWSGAFVGMQNFALDVASGAVLLRSCASSSGCSGARTKLMPRVKPMEITPGSDFVRHLGARSPGLDEAKAELQEVVEFLQRPEALRAPRRARAEGDPAPRPARHRQDPRREGGRRTSPARASTRRAPRRSWRCSPASARRGSASSSRRRARTRRRSSSSTSSTRSARPAAATASTASRIRR